MGRAKQDIDEKKLSTRKLLDEFRLRLAQVIRLASRLTVDEGVFQSVADCPGVQKSGIEFPEHGHRAMIVHSIGGINTALLLLD